MIIDLDKPIYDTLDLFRLYFGNDYIYALFIFCLFIAIGYIMTLIYKHLLLYVSKKTTSELDDELIEKAKKPVFVFIMLLGLKAIIAALELHGNTINTLLKIINSGLVVAFAYFLVILVDSIIEGWGRALKRKTRSKYSDTILPLIEKLIFIFFIISALIVILEIWGIEIAPFLAGLGIAGLAVGLALQDSLKDFVGGVNLIIDNTYKVGDKVRIDSGEVGEIYSISIRSTRIKTYDNNVIIIPNHIMASSKIINYAQPRANERGTVPFGVIYGSDIKTTKKIALEAVKAVKTVMDEPEPSIEFLELADYSLNFRALFWVKNFGDKWDIEREVVQSIYEALNREGIEFAFPTQTIHLMRHDKEEHT